MKSISGVYTSLFGEERRSVTRHYRLAYYIRDVGRCRYCGEYVPYDEFQLDHVVPYSKGGTELPWNLTVACEPCNKRKSSNTATAQWYPPTFMHVLFYIWFALLVMSGKTYTYQVGGSNE